MQQRPRTRAATSLEGLAKEVGSQVMEVAVAREEAAATAREEVVEELVRVREMAAGAGAVVAETEEEVADAMEQEMVAVAMEEVAVLATAEEVALEMAAVVVGRTVDQTFQA